MGIKITSVKVSGVKTNFYMSIICYLFILEGGGVAQKRVVFLALRDLSWVSEDFFYVTNTRASCLALDLPCKGPWSSLMSICCSTAVLGLVHRASYCRLRGTRENNDGYKKE